MNRNATILARIRPVLLDATKTDLFWASYSEDSELVQSTLKAHPTLILYTLCSWGTENWLYRGFRNVNCMGHLLATVDLGETFSELLWEDPIID